VTGEDPLAVTPPTWRPDLTDPNDLAEEVIRLEGYENLPSRLPQAPPGRGYTPEQRLRRRVGQALAGSGYVEVHCYPFVGDAAWDALGLDPDDDRRRTARLLNPLSEEEPALRTTLLPGLLTALRRNVGRGFTDLALFEIGSVFYPQDPAVPAPRPGAAGPPSEDEVRAHDGALPRQPRYVAAVLAGNREPTGWWGGPRPASWADAVEAARVVARAAGVELRVHRGQMAPWHPGRCAALTVGERVLGFAGELHPRVVAALGLPPRTAAMELDLDYLAEIGGGIVPAPQVSTYPVATQDVALVVDASVPAVDVEEALRAGAGELLESLRLLGEGRRSLAYALRFRAPDRTLTVEEATAARDQAVAAAARRTGAVLRGA
jgi:phenylalanyl-tRNA synthetase beta chain